MIDLLENYDINEDGVIYQIDKNAFPYDKEYVENSYVNRLGELSNYMAYLRLGYIIGHIGIPYSIMDVGYGDGSFLKACKKIIPTCAGNDISKYEIPEGCEFVSNITDRYFQVITFFDCLEHFENIDFVSSLQCKYLVLTVPYCHYHNKEWFKEWHHRKPDEHLWHFNLDSLNNFMKRMGYNLSNHSQLEDVLRNKLGNEQNTLTCIYKK